MGALVNHKGTRSDVNLISTEVEEHVDCARTGHAPGIHTTCARHEAEVEATHTRRRRMQDGQTIPLGGGTRELGRARKNRQAIGAHERPLSHDHDGTLRLGENLAKPLAGCDLGQRFRSRAEILVIIGQIDALADHADGQIAHPPPLEDARVENRRFLAWIRPDDQDRIRLLDAGDRRIEDVGGAAERGDKFHPILTAVDIGDAQRAEQVHRRLH